MARAVRPTYTLAAKMRMSARTELTIIGSRLMKKFWMVREMLLAPWSMRAWSMPGALSLRAKKAMRYWRIRSTTPRDSRWEMLIRSFSPKMLCPKEMPARRISFPSRTMLTMVKIFTAFAHVKSGDPTRALIASTVRSSTTAFTCASKEPRRVSDRVASSRKRCGFT